MQVKIVRDSMNRMLDLWKEIPDVIDDDSNDAAAELQSRSPVKGYIRSVLILLKILLTDFFLFFFCLVLSHIYYFGSWDIYIERERERLANVPSGFCDFEVQIINLKCSTCSPY